MPLWNLCDDIDDDDGDNKVGSMRCSCVNREGYHFTIASYIYLQSFTTKTHNFRIKTNASQLESQFGA